MIFVGMMALAVSSHAIAAPSIVFTEPTAGKLIGRGYDASVRFTINPTTELIADVRVAIGLAVPSFTQFCLGGGPGPFECVGWVSTKGVPLGLTSVTVVVVDESNQTTRASATIDVREPPRIKGMRPLELVTQANAPLQCIDFTGMPCVNFRIEEEGPEYNVWTPVASGAGDLVLPLAKYDRYAGHAPLRAIARDRFGVEIEHALLPIVDLTPGLTSVSKTPGTILGVTDKFILFHSYDTGLWIRNRMSGLDTNLTTNPVLHDPDYGVHAQLVDEGAVFLEGDSWSIFWGGTITRTAFRTETPTRHLTTFIRQLSEVPTNGRLVAYGSDTQAHECLVRDLATNTVRVAVDLRTLPALTPLCMGAAVSRNGDAYFISGSPSEPAEDVVRVSGNAVARMNFIGPKSWVGALDGQLPFWVKRYGNDPFADIYRGPTHFAEGDVALFRHEHLVFNEMATTKLRMADGSIHTVPSTFMAEEISETGELGLSVTPRDKTDFFIMPLDGSPTRVSGGFARIYSVGTGWLVAHGNMLRCIRAPCGPINPIQEEPEPPFSDAGAPVPVVDTGTAPDAGSTSEGDVGTSAGCGCHESAGASSTVSLLLAVLLLRGRRDRARL